MTDTLPGQSGVGRRIEPHRIEPGFPRVSADLGARQAGKADQTKPRKTRAQTLGDHPGRGNDVAGESARGELARPAVEQHHRLHPGLDLETEAFDHRLGEDADQALEARRVAVSPESRAQMIGRAPTLDRVASQSEGRAGKADERGLGGKRGADERDRLRHRSKPRGEMGKIEAVEIGRLERGKPRPFALGEGELAAQGPENEQDVAEQDGGIEAEATDGLQRCFGGGLGVEAEIEEGGLPGAQRAVFGEVTPRLTHEPDRGRGQGLTRQHAQEFLFHRDLLPLSSKTWL